MSRRMKSPSAAIHLLIYSLILPPSFWYTGCYPGFQVKDLQSVWFLQEHSSNIWGLSERTKPLAIWRIVPVTLNLQEWETGEAYELYTKMLRTAIGRANLGRSVETVVYSDGVRTEIQVHAVRQCSVTAFDKLSSKTNHFCTRLESRTESLAWSPATPAPCPPPNTCRLVK